MSALARAESGLECLFAATDSEAARTAAVDAILAAAVSAAQVWEESFCAQFPELDYQNRNPNLSSDFLLVRFLFRRLRVL